MRIERIALEEIDLHDQRFRFSYYFDLGSLFVSVQKIGLVYPPLVVKREGPKYVLVSGWKRIHACLKLSLKHLPVLILNEDDDSRAFLISFYENMTTRKFDLLEKAEILRLLIGFIKDEKIIIRSFLPHLEIPSTHSHLDAYLEIARLHPRWKEMIFKKKMAFSSVELLLLFMPDEREQLFPLLEPLNMNKQKRILEDLHDLSRRSQQPLQKILHKPEIRSLLNDKNLSPLQKAENVRSWAKKKRYPLLSTWEDSFRSSMKKAQLLPDVTYDPTSLFEDGEFSVTFDIKSKDSFLRKIAKLQELISDEELFRMFEDHPDG